MKALVKRMLRYFNLYLPIRVDGVWLNAPVLAGQGLSNVAGLTEPWMAETLRRLLSADTGRGLILDVGVNFAQTLLKLKALSPEALYIGFEPNPFCVQYVETTIRVNKFTNCRIIPIGLGSQAEVREFFTRSEGDSAGTILEGLRPGSGGVSGGRFVPIFPLDDIAHLLPGDPTLIKIDVEGAEVEVISGMRRLLRDRRPIVICEVLLSHTAGQVSAQRERNRIIEDLLQSIEFEIFQISKAHPVRMKRVPEFSTGVYDWKSFEVCDYILVPAEKSERVCELFEKGN